MNYYELRKQICRLIPRQTVLTDIRKKFGLIKEKGRKSNYYQFDLLDREWKKNERILDLGKIKNFIEVSLRASGCPMPLNADVWDGLLCGYGCKYCFSDLSRYKIFTAFFDNSKKMGYRSCSPDYFKTELDRYLSNRAKGGHVGSNEIQKAIDNNIPIRIGIRFEDFLPLERNRKVTLELLKYLASNKYPVMINTKSDLVAEDNYLKVLMDNAAKAAIHMTLISSDNKILKKLEPGAPSYKRRLEAMKMLSAAGVRVVARIEPYMVFINDKKEDVQKYIEEVYSAGIRHITFDTYSYSAGNFGIRENFNQLKYDFNRMFLLTSDSQAIGSLLLGKFMDLFREKGFRCSTFDLGNVPLNSQEICCEVGDWFTDSKFNRGSIVSVIRYIQRERGQVVTWDEYERFVNGNGGFLSDRLKNDIFELWNLGGNDAYSPKWAQGLVPVGWDENRNMKWRYEDQNDFRLKILEDCL